LVPFDKLFLIVALTCDVRHDAVNPLIGEVGREPVFFILWTLCPAGAIGATEFRTAAASSVKLSGGRRVTAKSKSRSMLLRNPNHAGS